MMHILGCTDCFILSEVMLMQMLLLGCDEIWSDVPRSLERGGGAFMEAVMGGRKLLNSFSCDLLTKG